VCSAFIVLALVEWREESGSKKARMKVVAAYLLAVLGGNTSPSSDDIKSILGSGTYFSLFSFCSNCYMFCYNSP
jgi:hypothetical protein